MFPSQHFYHRGKYYYPSYSAYYGSRDGVEYPSLPIGALMEPGDTWVERDANGKAYWVRKKYKRSSTCALLADALVPVRRSLSLFRNPRREFQIMPASVSNPLQMPASTSALQPNQQLASPSSPPIMVSPNSTFYPSQENRTPNMLNSNAQLVPLNTGFPPPQHPPTAPAHPGLSLAPLPPGAHALSPPQFVGVDDLKYKCSICGRFRSPRYHYRHPLAPGELPKQTVCRRCRKSGTESEDSHGSPRARDYRRSRSRSRSRFSDDVELHVISNDVERRPAHRSSSHVSIIRRGRSRGRDHSRRKIYRSGSLDSDLGRLSVVLDDERPRRRRSPGVEVIRYIDESRPRSRVRETIYVDDLPRRPATRETITIEERVAQTSTLRYEDDYSGEDEIVLPRRPPTPMPRIIHLRESEPELREPRRIERREYYDGPTRVIEETEIIRPARPPSRPPSRSMQIMRIPAGDRPPSTTRYTSSSHDSYDSNRFGRRSSEDNDDWYDRRGRERRGCRDRRSSHYSRYSDEGSPRHAVELGSPPPIRYVNPRRRAEEMERREISHQSAVDRHSGHSMAERRRRSRSRSRSVAGSRRESPSLSSGEEVVVGGQAREFPHDYDMYDKDGMRVRVREI